MVQSFNRFLQAAWKRERALIVLGGLSCLSIGAYELGRPAWTKHGPNSRRPRYFAQAPHPRAPAIEVPIFFVSWRNNFLQVNSKTDKLGLVRGIFLGEDSVVSPSTRQLFADAGLVHLLAASGFNCWIVATVFGGLFSLLTHFFTPLLPASFGLLARKLGQSLARLAGAWLFWLWTDQSPPITRSVALVSGKFVLDATGLVTSFGRTLLVQYFLSLIIMPRMARNASFQLTFGCLFGLLVVPRLLEPLKPRLVPGFLWAYVSTNLGAILGALPTTWFVFGELNFTSLLTNWLAIPPVSFVIMPLSLFQMFIIVPFLEPIPPVMRLAEFLGSVLAQVASLLSLILGWWMRAVAVLK